MDTHTRACAHTYIYIYVCVYVNTCIYICVCVSVCMCTCIDEWISSVKIYLSIYLSIYLCIWLNVTIQIGGIQARFACSGFIFLCPQNEQRRPHFCNGWTHITRMDSFVAKCLLWPSPSFRFDITLVRLHWSGPWCGFFTNKTCKMNNVLLFS